MEIKEVRLRFLESVRDKLWKQKEALRRKLKLKVFSWENYFKFMCNIK